MKKLFIALVLLSGMLIGCTCAETPREHCRRLKLQGDVQFRTCVEDLDYVLLIDRNTRLTRWCTRFGR